MQAAAFERRILRLYDQMLDVPLGDREGWLREHSSGDPLIVHGVQALMDAELAARMLPTVPPEPLATADDGAAPERIGDYRILAELGRGGMGVVYRAERADGLFDHQVAIKLIRTAGFSAHAGEQFARERRILARLRHPHIAQLLDGGTTADGSAYIIMELIAGTPITDYCASNKLDLAARLSLFVDAATAIEHAHRNLIVHADIKPNNVLVEHGFGVKLLDFGIARLLDEEGATSGGGHTPGFASPDRIAGLPSTPADDIFAAGLLLAQLIEAVPGVDADLQAVVAKAQAADVARRYGAMSELIADIASWQHSLPTIAAPPSGLRRLRLFWQRHRVALPLIAAALIGLIAATAIITSLYFRSERQRTVLAARDASTRRMATYIIDDIDPQLARLAGSLALREQLVSQTSRYLATLEAERPTSAALQREIAGGYLHLARIYGLDPSGGLGDLDRARDSLARARTLLTAAATAEPDAAELLFLRGQEKTLEASEVFAAADNNSARSSVVAAAQAQAFLQRYLRDDPNDVGARLVLWRAQLIPERAYVYLGRPQAGLALIEATLRNATLPVRTPAERADRDFLLNGAYLLLGEGYSRSDPPRALRFYDLLIERVARLQRAGASDWENNLTQASGFAERAALRDNLNDLRGATADYREAVELLEQLYLIERNHLIGEYLNMVRVRLANLYARADHDAEADRLSGQAIAWLTANSASAPQEGARLRLLGLALHARALRLHGSADRGTACQAERGAAAIWATIQRMNAAAPLDTERHGPIDQLRTAMAGDC